VVPLGVVYSIAIRLGLAVISFIVVLFLLITQLVNVESLRNFACRTLQGSIGSSTSARYGRIALTIGCL